MGVGVTLPVGLTATGARSAPPRFANESKEAPMSMSQAEAEPAVAAAVARKFKLPVPSVTINTSDMMKVLAVAYSPPEKEQRDEAIAIIRDATSSTTRRIGELAECAFTHGLATETRARRSERVCPDPRESVSDRVLDAACDSLRNDRVILARDIENGLTVLANAARRAIDERLKDVGLRRAAEVAEAGARRELDHVRREVAGTQVNMAALEREIAAKGESIRRQLNILHDLGVRNEQDRLEIRALKGRIRRRVRAGQRPRSIKGGKA